MFKNLVHLTGSMWEADVADSLGNFQTVRICAADTLAMAETVFSALADVRSTMVHGTTDWAALVERDRARGWSTD